MSRKNYLALILPLIAGVLAACGAGPAAPTAAPTAVADLPTATPAAQSTAAATTGAIRFELTGEGNTARYRVREQLASLTLPSDAVGVTSDISGVLVLNADGTAIVSDESKFIVNLEGLQSDQSMRDRYVQSNILQTRTYPTVELVPKQIGGLDSPLTASGEVHFQLIGDLTVQGITRSTTWEVTGTATDGRELTGTAATHFTFADFGLNQPRVPRVLSIEDNIQLELDFHFVRVE